MRKFLLTNLLLLASLCIFAGVSEDNPEDCTSYIVNPSFENGTDGWQSANLQSQSNNDFPKKAGSNYMEKWVSSGNAVGNGSASQVLSGLPIGKYKLVVGAQNLDQSNKTAQKTGAVIYAGDQKTNVYTPDDYSVYFTYISGEVEIGFKATNAQGNWIAVDNFRLYRIGEVEIELLIPELNKIIADAEARYSEDKKGAAELKAEIDKAKALVAKDDATSEEITAEIAVLSERILTFRKDNASEAEPFDVTSYIVNPDFENGTNGWVNISLTHASNKNFSLHKGGYFLEKWVSSGAVGNASVSQVIKNLPNGQYKLTAAAQNLNQQAGHGNDKNAGAVIYAGSQEEPVYTANDYSVKFTSISGEVEIGFKAENAQGNWICVDNFRLYLIGNVDNDAIVAELGRLISEAEALKESMMSATAAKTLQEAIDKAKVITTESSEADVREATMAIQTAIEAAKASVVEYQALVAQIETVEAIYDATKEGAEEFKDEIDKAKELATNADATSAELAAEIEALDKALLAFNIANATPGTGTAPRITVTHKYVAMGSTEALVRATSTGSNILESGVCWSTEHNPTVLDNRTTKSFSLKGTIFHIKGLEPATVYYVRAYVMNKTYTVAYGDEIKVVTHPKGTCTGSWNEGAPDEAANTRCRNAINETIEYFNQWTGIKGFHLSGNYGAQTPTADCGYGGWMRIGPNAGNQAIGTVIHETGHGVGVGTSSRWSDKNVHDWKWLGREANDILKFLENSTAENVYMVGDGQHGWGNVASYDWFVNGADKDKHTELQYIGGCVLLYGFFIDGLNPTYSYTNGISGYTYNFDDDKKYYLMNKSEEGGLGKGLLYQRTNTAIAWKPYVNSDEVSEVSDEAAWYLEYNPQNGYYMFKNAESGMYLTHAAGGSNVTLKKISSGKPSATEYFQLMPDRTDVTITVGSKKVTTHGYWFTWNSSGDKAMQAGKMGNLYGTISQVGFNYAETPSQQWIIISEDELEQYGMKPAVPTNIGTVTIDGKDVEKTVVGIYTIGGTKLNVTQPGINIIRYSDGTSKKVLVK